MAPEGSSGLPKAPQKPGGLLEAPECPGGPQGAPGSIVLHIKCLAAKLGWARAGHGEAHEGARRCTK
eukprot:1052700-Alexandrium_andersonii.AAC.1